MRELLNTEILQDKTISKGKDSLGIISFQKLAPAQKNKLRFPAKSYDQGKIEIDTAELPLLQEDTVSLIQKPIAVDTKLDFPYATSKGLFQADFAVKLHQEKDASISFKSEYDRKPSFTQEFQDKVFTINYKELNDTSHNWMFWIVLLTLLIYGWLRIFYKKQLNLIFSAIFYFNLSQKYFRDSNEITQRFAVLLQIIFSVNLSLLSFQIYKLQFPIELSGLQNISIVLGGAVVVLLIYGIKDFVLKMIGSLFLERQYAMEYLSNVHLFNRVAGIVLFPVIIGIAFVNSNVISHWLLVGIGGGIFGVFYFLRLVRGVQISFKYNVSILYVILYFCTLEFLPIAIIVKTGELLLNYFNQ